MPAWAPDPDCSNAEGATMETKSGPERGAWSRRPSYTQRQMLTAELLNAGLDDELKRQRLLNRAVHGFGVVLGLGVSADAEGRLDLQRGCLELTPGLALDRRGRMLLWEGGRLGIGDLVGPAPERAGRYTLRAHFSARPPLVDDCGTYSGDRAHWSEEGVVFSLRWDRNEVDRGCPSHADGACLTHEQYLVRRTGGLLGGEGTGVDPSGDVDWLLKPPGESRPTGHDGWTYDPDPQACVPLACIQICDLAEHRSGPDDAEAAQDAGPVTNGPSDGVVEEQPPHGLGPRPPDEPHCEPRYGLCPSSPVEVPGIRPLVYRNPLLYELVNCCDADTARVETISWQAWIDRGWPSRVPWEAFARQLEPTSEGFEIWFTRRLDPLSLHEAGIFMTAWYQDDDASWRSYRVPLRKIEPLTRDGHVRGARLVPDEEWLNAEVRGRRSNLFGGSRFEVTIRGQLVRDTCGRMLDARPVGLDCGVRCQARPGAELISAFQVAPHPRYGSAARSHEGSGEGSDAGEGFHGPGGSGQEGR
ncbi:hypothetical protein [Geodermatophilus sp. SYSU D00766]